MTQNHFGWSLVDLLSQALERNEREAVRGDLEEAGESSWRALLDVSGLVIRRQLKLWKNWRPWLAAFGLALPSTFLLMGLSVSVSKTFQQIVDPAILTVRPGLALFVCNVVLLFGWAWVGGLVAGSLSRKTLWATAALSCLPCLFCLSRFRIECLSRFSLLLFLGPAILGVLCGLRLSRIKFSAALVLAVGLTLLTIPAWGQRGAWIPNWALSWPAWYLVVSARNRRTAQ